MRIARIYYEGILSSDCCITLSQENSHYLQHVLRIKIGAPIILFNGLGGEFRAKVTAINKKAVSVQVHDFNPDPIDHSCKIHLAQGISKGEKMDWIIQKAVELGVSEITPVVTHYCNVQLDSPRAAKRLIHWNKVSISACEQSGRTRLPILNPVISYDDCIKQRTDPLKLICHPHSHTNLRDLHEFRSQDLLALTKPRQVMVLIGPEGGLSDEEIKSALAADFVGVSLGPRILRTETAAIAAIAVIQNLWGDLG